MILLKLTVTDDIQKICAILQNGFFIYARCGITVRELLSEECELNNEIIENKILTVFLNSKPVDNIDKAVIEEGAVLALSGALPGLLGAVFRKDSIYSSFRKSISYINNPNKLPDKNTPRKITIKLFNSIINELGSHFLQLGIILKTQTFLDLLRNTVPLFLGKCSFVLADGREISFDKILKKDFTFKENYIHLKVNIDN